MSNPTQRLQVLALVSGFPGARRQQRPLLMLQAHIDDSRTGSETLVLAGYIATVDEWLAFSDEWGEHLRLAGMPYFKMSEASGLALEIVASFYRIIEKHVPAAIACVVPSADLRAAVDKSGLRTVFRDAHLLDNAYLWAFKAIVNFTAQFQQQMGLNEPIDFIFDEQRDQKANIRAGWDTYIRTVTPEVRALTGDEPVFRDDKKVLPLQAADFYAWWMRKWWEDAGSIHDSALPFPWTTKRPIHRLHLTLDEEFFSEQLAYITANLAKQALAAGGMLGRFKISELTEDDETD